MKADSNVPADAQSGLDEAALVAGLARGDTNVTREFLKRTHGPVYALTGRLTKDPDRRHDWTGDTLLRIVAELGRGRFVYRWPGCFWAWFQKRSYFLLLNQYRDHRRQNDRWTMGEIGEDLAARFPGRTGPDGQQILEDLEARQALESCLAKLPSEDQQQALTQLLFEGMTYEEIATHCGAALNTVRSWIRRGRLAVRKCVAEAYGLGPGETPWK